MVMATENVASQLVGVVSFRMRTNFESKKMHYDTLGMIRFTKNHCDLVQFVFCLPSAFDKFAFESARKSFAMPLGFCSA